MKNLVTLVLLALLPLTLLQAEVSGSIRFIHFDKEKGTIEVCNDSSSKNLDQYNFYYLIRDHGKQVFTEPFKVSAAPGQRVKVQLKNIPQTRNTTGDVRIEFYATIRIAEPSLPTGTVVAREQAYIHTFYKNKAPQQTPATLKENATQALFTGKEFKATFNKQSGLLVSYQYKGTEYILDGQGPRPNFWRAPTDNDYAANLPSQLEAWKSASCQKVTATRFSAQTGEVTCSYSFARTDATWDITYRISADGTLKITNRFVASNPQTPMIPRIGLRMQLPESLTRLTYYGRGPEENYRDRRISQFFGEYTTLIKEIYQPLARPQENNHHTDIYWCALTNKKGAGLLIVADRTFELNVSNVSLEKLDGGANAPSAYPEREKLVDLFIDYRMMGILGGNGWGTIAQEPYLIRTGKENAVEYGFTLVPFSKGTEFKNLIYQY